MLSVRDYSTVEGLDHRRFWFWKNGDCKSVGLVWRRYFRFWELEIGSLQTSSGAVALGSGHMEKPSGGVAPVYYQESVLILFQPFLLMAQARVKVIMEWMLMVRGLGCEAGCG